MTPATKRSLRRAARPQPELRSRRTAPAPPYVRAAALLHRAPLRPEDIRDGFPRERRCARRASPIALAPGPARMLSATPSCAVSLAPDRHSAAPCRRFSEARSAGSASSLRAELGRAAPPYRSASVDNLAPSTGW